VAWTADRSHRHSWYVGYLQSDPDLWMKNLTNTFLVVLLTVSLIVVLSRGFLSLSLAGLMLTIAGSLTDELDWMVRSMTIVETDMCHGTIILTIASALVIKSLLK
jgi:hypothetical protein